ncbi:AAA family ATPase [Lysinibacillus fusiformis]|uniref:AAA family ATPase n=1 Tax=Lysinibacillus fusiformis TaxID=28031 RepID=UPI002E1B1C2D|nr:AAA family ATPase [Lysinibacillus fusiformis]MED4077581.1 AAA family ATPase [Lysinibacillus fusiformis]
MNINQNLPLGQSVQEKLKGMQYALNKKFFEREDAIEGILLGMLSKQNTLLIGEAGTAKSALISAISKSIEGAAYFQWLLGQTTTPEELFGPLSLKDLEQGVYKRNTANKLPNAHLAFLDEIFKSNSAILNSMLTIINERIYYNNGGVINSPLMSLVGASNEYPMEEGLEALFDRFMLRFEIGYMSEKDSFIGMLEGANVQIPTINVAELVMAQSIVQKVIIPKEVLETLFEVRLELRNEGIVPSDRRFKQSLSLLQAKAFLEGRNAVVSNDLVILGNALWVEPEQIQKTKEIAVMFAKDPVLLMIDNFKKEMLEIQENINSKQGEGLSVMGGLIAEANSKINSVMEELKDLQSRYPNRTEIADYQVELQTTKQRNADLMMQGTGL